MPRTRSIKPGFFTNDQLAEIEPLGRLLFAGLWTQADRDGRLLDRPRKLKAELLPYDDCDADALLAQLAARGFIMRYVADGVALIQVVTWGKHQQPHINEKPSDLPAPVLSTTEHQTSIIEAPEQNGTSTVQAPGQHGANTPRYLESRYLESRTGNLELEDEDGAPTAPAAALPETVQRLHESLAGQTGYDPSPAFLQKLASKYGHLDLESEALKMLSWLPSKANKRKQICSTGFVLKWLEGAGVPRVQNGYAPSAPRASPPMAKVVLGAWSPKGYYTCPCGRQGQPQPGSQCACGREVPQRPTLAAAR